MAIVDDNGNEVEVAEPSGKAMLIYHFLLTFTANAVVCGASIALFSTLGIADTVFQFLEDNWWFCMPVGGLSTFLILMLYLLDFFWPPHLNQVFALWDGDRLVGRSILGASLVLFVVAALFLTTYFISLPSLISIILCPLAVFGAHVVYDPFKPADLREQEFGKRKTEIINSDNTQAKIDLLRRITGEELNVMMYYKGCVATFVVSFLVNLLVFLVGTVALGTHLDDLTQGMDSSARDRKYIQWSLPLVLGLSNLVFGLFAMLRVFVQQAYSRTDTYKNRIIADLMTTTIVHEMTAHKLDVLRRARQSNVQQLEEREEDLQHKRQQYLQQHNKMAQQLSTIVKGVVCAFIVLLGLCYCARQMLYASTHIATMVAGTVAIFFVAFCLFTYVSLWRVVMAMGKWMRELPAWKTLCSLLSNDWVKAGILCVFLPLVPVIMFLSFLNQLVRNCRGIYQKYDCTHQGRILAKTEHATGEMTPISEELGSQDGAAEALRITPRVWKRIAILRGWNWLSLTPRIYILCGAYMAYTVCPVMLNVGLAAMNKFLDEAGVHFSIVLVAIFVVGVFCFLLPPVPGAIIYLFGGMVSSAQCPPKNTDTGFWIGALVSILLGLVMKLVGCSIQQVGIGGLMGKSRLVRQTACVHKVQIRCIEFVLRQKGFSMGKLAILCGGPDWPTSVLAGILGLPLLEMLIGTLPIIFFIIPFGLTGSFYVKSGEGGMWTSAPQLMLVTAFMVNMTLWAMMAWAVQQAFEKHSEELSRPLPQNVDLEWLDHRAAVVQEKLQLTWADVPAVLRVLWFLGALCHIFVCYAFTLGSSYLLGSFQVHDDIDSLVLNGEWSSSDGLLTYPCMIIFAGYFMLWSLPIAARIWHHRRTGTPRRLALQEVDQTEAEWKEEYLKECERRRLKLMPAPKDPEEENLADITPVEVSSVPEETKEPLKEEGKEPLKEEGKEPLKAGADESAGSSGTMAM